jgi:hypothetical protein
MISLCVPASAIITSPFSADSTNASIGTMSLVGTRACFKIVQIEQLV